MSGKLVDEIHMCRSVIRKPPSKTAEVEQQKYIINVMSPNDIIPQLIYKVAQQLTMINAAVLFDESFGESRPLKLSTIFNQNSAENGRNGKNLVIFCPSDKLVV